LTTPVSLPTTPSIPTTTINVVTETGNLINQLTVSGLPGTNVRAQIQQELNNLRRNGFAILSNDVKGDTKLGHDDSVLTVKVSQPDHSTDPFQRSTMPIITQLGHASQPAQKAAQTANKGQETIPISIQQTRLKLLNKTTKSTNKLSVRTPLKRLQKTRSKIIRFTVIQLLISVNHINIVPQTLVAVEIKLLV
jgi:hypothetical protein